MLLSAFSMVLLLASPASDAAGSQSGPAAAPASPRAAAPTTESRFGDAVQLFDGKTLAGWKPFLPEGDPAKVWSVADGVLRCSGNPVGYIATEKEYESFELTLEWRFDPKKGAGNSGVLLRVQRPDKVWPKSVEAQLQSESAGDIWNIDDVPMKVEAKRTNGRHTEKLHPTNEKPLGEWNRYRIVLDGGKLELYVNDLLQNTATDVEVKPGRIALQSEGAYIEFRNLAIRPLKQAASAPSKNNA